MRVEAATARYAKTAPPIGSITVHTLGTVRVACELSASTPSTFGTGSVNTSQNAGIRCSKHARKSRPAKMFKGQISMCASQKSSGASVARLPAKSLKSFAPLEKFSGAFACMMSAIERAFGRKKTSEARCLEDCDGFVYCLGAPLLNPAPHGVTSSTQLVNTLVTGASK